MQSNALRVALLLSLVFVWIPLAAAPLGSSEMNVENMTLDLTSVERKGNVVTVKWTVRNAGTASKTVAFSLTGKKVTSYLVDEENGTKYYALTDKEGNTLATEHVYIGSDAYGIYQTLKAGEAKRYWAKFPAPPPAVKTINIFFTDAEPFEGIAIMEKK